MPSCAIVSNNSAPGSRSVGPTVGAALPSIPPHCWSAASPVALASAGSAKTPCSSIRGTAVGSCLASATEFGSHADAFVRFVALWHMSCMSGRLPNRRVRCAVSARRPQVHQLSDHRTQGDARGAVASGNRRLAIWLRHLPGGLSLESQSAAGRPRVCARGDLVDARALLGLDAAAFAQRFKGTALYPRPGRPVVLRNAALVLGNIGNEDALPVLRAALDDAEPLIRDAAVWAIGRIEAQQDSRRTAMTRPTPVGRLAVASLVGAAVLVVIGKLLERPDYLPFWGGLSAAFGEAALVGGLADWFAVRALFAHPMGLPFPHTALIPRNRLRIIKQIRSLVETQWLPHSMLVGKVNEFDFVARLAPALDSLRPRLHGLLQSALAEALRRSRARSIGEAFRRSGGRQRTGGAGDGHGRRRGSGCSRTAPANADRLRSRRSPRTLVRLGDQPENDSRQTRPSRRGLSQRRRLEGSRPDDGRGFRRRRSRSRCGDLAAGAPTLRPRTAILRRADAPLARRCHARPGAASPRRSRNGRRRREYSRRQCGVRGADHPIVIAVA